MTPDVSIACWIFSYFLLLSLTTTTCASTKVSAWNGHTTPDSTVSKHNRFTPFYVPPGAKDYDSNSPFVLYTGAWKDRFSSAYIHGALRSTSQPGAAAWLSFNGSSIEWFGNKDKMYGIANVYIDGLLVQSVDAWSPVPLKQQRIFWSYDLQPGLHIIKLVNTGRRKNFASKHLSMNVDGFVVSRRSVPVSPKEDNTGATARPPPQLLLSHSDISYNSLWTLTQKGSTGVNAMQLAVISSTHAIVLDKVEHNPLTLDGHPAWAVLYNLETHSVKPLHIKSNSFCAGGSFLGNGTMISVGGNPVVEDRTSPADFGDVDGLQSVRLFHPCESDQAEGCDLYENHGRIHMASPRWYNTVLRISDGSAMIIGGSKRGGWINNMTVNNPTIEYYPPKNIHGFNGLPITLPFLVNTLNSNLFPLAFALPDGRVFLAANQDAMIYDWKTNTETPLPKIPNGVRVTYPMTGAGLLLPLKPDNNYEAEILICGGSNVDDKKPGYEISSQDPASSQCSRMVMTDNGIAKGWEVEQMPQARIMPDTILLPTGEIVIVNGAQTGISGYGNVLNQVGASNADKPLLSPVLYRPLDSSGNRFSSLGMPTSDIPRMYHSVATLTPNGDIMIAGSNPNLDRSEIAYGTEYRVEWLSPPYIAKERPSIVDSPSKLRFGETVNLKIASMPDNYSDVKVVLMDFGFITHSVHANSRMVYLRATPSKDVITVEGPPNGNIYPPGPGWLFYVVDGVPSKGVKVMVGDGQSPPVDEDASNNVLKQAVDRNDLDNGHNGNTE